MHSIRSRVRHAAWNSDDPSPYSALNPFRRVDSRPRTHIQDEESSPAHDIARPTHSDSCLANEPEHVQIDFPRHSFTDPPMLNRRHEDLETHVVELQDIKRKIATAPDSTWRSYIRAWNSHKRFGFWSQVKSIFGTWSSVLLVFVPIGFALRYVSKSAIAVFCVNFIAIIPSNVLISYGLEELSLRVGSTVSLFLDQTFSNAAQLISAILLLKIRQIKVLQISLLGSMLSNLLLMTGIAFLLGGIGRVEQFYSIHVAQALGMFLILAVLSLLVPTTSRLLADTAERNVELQSRGISVVIMISYLLWLYFQYANPNFFKGPAQKSVKRRRSNAKESGEALKCIATIGAGSAALAGSAANEHVFSTEIEPEQEDEKPEPQISVIAALVTLIAATVLLFFNTLFATDSIQGLLLESNLTESFVGIVILPLVGLSPTAIFCATKDKMDMCLSLTLEKCIQTALMVVPLTVIIAWGMHIDSMTLEFGGFSVATLFASVLIVTYVIQKGSSNWLIGALLIKVFIIIGLSSYFVA